MQFRHLAVLMLLVVAFLMPARPGTGAELATFDKSSLTIDTKTGPQHFIVELALNPAQQMQGLMYRRTMAPDAGMLFDFRDTAIRSFWMKNTVIPLDMLFITANGEIADIHERAVPQSEATIVSSAPVRAVLELNGGTVARLGIHIGDFVLHPIFGNGNKAPTENQ